MAPRGPLDALRAASGGQLGGSVFSPPVSPFGGKRAA